MVHGRQTCQSFHWRGATNSSSMQPSPNLHFAECDRRFRWIVNGPNDRSHRAEQSHDWQSRWPMSPSHTQSEIPQVRHVVAVASQDPEPYRSPSSRAWDVSALHRATTKMKDFEWGIAGNFSTEPFHGFTNSNVVEQGQSLLFGSDVHQTPRVVFRCSIFGKSHLVVAGWAPPTNCNISWWAEPTLR